MAPAQACPFCSKLGKTFSETTAEADLSLWGTLSASRIRTDAPPGEPSEETQVHVRDVFKNNPILAGRQDILVARYIPRVAKQSSDYVLFAEVIDDQIDPFRAIPVPDDKLATYLAASTKVDQLAEPERLAFYYQYLGDPNLELSTDAYKEFARAPYPDVYAARKAYQPAELRKLIADPHTPEYRIGLFGLLLGVSGSQEDGDFLRKTLDQQKKLDVSVRFGPASGIDGLLGGYCLLDPEKGLDYLLDLLTNPKTDFHLRYAALGAARFLLTEDVNFERPTLLGAIRSSLTIPEATDLVIDELRKQKDWDSTADVLAVAKTPLFDKPAVQQSLLRFAIQSPTPEAKAFVKVYQEKDPQLLSVVEEGLKFEELVQTQLGAPSPSAKRNGRRAQQNPPEEDR